MEDKRNPAMTKLSLRASQLPTTTTATAAAPSPIHALGQLAILLPLAKFTYDLVCIATNLKSAILFTVQTKKPG